MTEVERVPWFGARRMAKELQQEVVRLRARCQHQEQEALMSRTKSIERERQLEELGALTVIELEERRQELQVELSRQRTQLEGERLSASQRLSAIEMDIKKAQEALVLSNETALLQEAGIYEYRHPLADVVACEKELEELQSQIKQMAKRNGGAVLAETNWSVNGSATEGRAMVREFSTLMLRAFNAEADDLVRTLKPHRLDRAKERLEKIAATIEKLGRTMRIRISTPYLQLRERELELTADYLQKLAEEKEIERVERERLREERKAQQEMERERAKLEKERQHYENAMEVLARKGDEAGIERLKGRLEEVDKAIADVDYRAANIRAGYVYVISNVGSFGEQMVKVGMTRRLDPADRIRELSDASVPFNFDTHALFFSKDAVGIEQAMHERLQHARVNRVNFRREFFRVTCGEVKKHLAELSGELLEFHEHPEALEFRQSQKLLGPMCAGVSEG